MPDITFSGPVLEITLAPVQGEAATTDVFLDYEADEPVIVDASV